MQVHATITSKRQLTIPIEIFRKGNFLNNTKVIIKEVPEGILVQPVSSVIEELAGSVHIPKKMKAISPDKAIMEAKKLRFSK